MNRLPANRNNAKNEHLEKRVTTLTWLVGVQIALLVVLLGMELWPTGTNGPAVAESGETEQVESADAGMDDPAADGPADITGDVSTTPAGPTEAALDDPIRIEVLNGCGERGLAARFAGVLREAGFDVRDTKNADHHEYSATTIIDRNMKPGAGQHLADVLGVAPVHLRTQANPNLVDVDVTLILGADHAALNVHPGP